MITRSTAKRAAHVLRILPGVLFVQTCALVILMAPVVATMIRGGWSARQRIELDKPVPSPRSGNGLRARISQAVYATRAQHLAEARLERELVDLYVFEETAARYAHIRPGDGTHARALAIATTARRRHASLILGARVSDEEVALMDAIRAADILAAATTPVHPPATVWGAPLYPADLPKPSIDETGWRSFTSRDGPSIDERAPRLALRDAPARAPRAPALHATAEPIWGGGVRSGVPAR